jgi:hypothetical protein
LRNRRWNVLSLIDCIPSKGLSIEPASRIERLNISASMQLLSSQTRENQQFSLTRSLTYPRRKWSCGYDRGIRNLGRLVAIVDRFGNGVQLLLIQRTLRRPTGRPPEQARILISHRLFMPKVLSHAKRRATHRSWSCRKTRD